MLDQETQKDNNELLSLKNIVCTNYSDQSTKSVSQTKLHEENQIDNMLFSDPEDEDQ